MRVDPVSGKPARAIVPGVIVREGEGVPDGEARVMPVEPVPMA
jgi:hypothetical protein